MKPNRETDKPGVTIEEKDFAVRNPLPAICNPLSFIPHPLFLYNLLLTAVALPALPLAGLALLLRPHYRHGLMQRLGFLPSTMQQQVKGRAPLWLHAPSVGETLAAQPFLRALKQTFSSHPLVLSGLTATAHGTARKRIPEADTVMYFPLDHPLCIRQVFKHLVPAAFFFTETEMWPNFLSTLIARNVPTFLVSGRFSERALQRYGTLRPLFLPIFQNLTLCCMQTRGDAERIIAAGASPDRVLVTGNFKVDAVQPQGDQGPAVLKAAGLGERPMLIAASTHRGEETVVLRVYHRLLAAVPRPLLLLAPRHPERFAEVESLLKKGDDRYLKRSQLRETPTVDTDVLLLDTLGELSSFYPAAALAFVGGSLIKGPRGHSVIEPALAGVPVCFGPHMDNFAEGGGFEVRDLEGFYQVALRFLSDPIAGLEAGSRASLVIQHEQGAVERTLASVLQYWRPHRLAL
jgi:3-deoxy-D-manno-octulosonic-acid transferase